MEEKTYTQAELNEMMKAELKKVREEYEQKRKEIIAEVGGEIDGIDYKAEIEKLRTETEELQKRGIAARKQTALLLAGYSSEQVARYAEFVTGETDEEIKASIEGIKRDIPPKRSMQGADPSNDRKKSKGIWNPFN